MPRFSKVELTLLGLTGMDICLAFCFSFLWAADELPRVHDFSLLAAAAAAAAAAAVKAIYHTEYINTGVRRRERNLNLFSRNITYFKCLNQ